MDISKLTWGMNINAVLLICFRVTTQRSACYVTQPAALLFWRIEHGCVLGNEGAQVLRDEAAV